MTPTNLIEQLLRDEGEILHAYQDKLGFWTIGSGILIDQRGGGITHEENLYLTSNRAERARAAVRTKLPWTLQLDEIRRAVFENMAYNLGIGNPEKGNGLLGFPKMLAHAQAGEFSAAAADGLNSLWAREVGDRAKRLMKQLETGQWQ